jgi:hypothetical protein
VEAEWASLKEAVAGLNVELAQLPQPCTLSALEAELRKGSHILHFVGHGSYNKKREQAVLFLADGQNQVELVHDADLAAMLARQLADTNLQRDDKLRLVFLASCQTATRSPADAFRGFAPALVVAGVPAVLAMQDLVPVDTAREFAGTFYRQLLQHGRVDLAGNEARSALLTAKLPGAAIPVLFMRLRSGQLLGRRGRITSDRSDQDFWTFLLDYIANGQCTPFLGPRVNTGLLPGPAATARALAARHKYPLPDRDDLTKVAQFIALKAPGVLRSNYTQFLQRRLFTYLDYQPTREEKRRYGQAGLNETVQGLNWAERVLAVQENAIHHLLADLKLSLYMTTNFDNFMVEALKHKGLTDARQAGLRWNPAEDRTEKEKYTIPQPTRDAPLVLHLNGYEDEADPEQLRHLVLSEDDFLAHLVRISREQQRVLPMNILQLLSQNSFLFLGYSLGDWEFRIILQGLLQEIAKTGGKELHVGVQLDTDDYLKDQEAVDYFKRYLGQFNIDIYWGTSQQFVTELHSRWTAYGDSWDDWDDSWEDE